MSPSDTDKKSESINNQYQKWKSNITSDHTDIKKITKEFYKQVYANKLENLWRYKIPRKAHPTKLT